MTLEELWEQLVKETHGELVVHLDQKGRVCVHPDGDLNGGYKGDTLAEAITTCLAHKMPDEVLDAIEEVAKRLLGFDLPEFKA